MTAKKEINEFEDMKMADRAIQQTKSLISAPGRLPPGRGVSIPLTDRKAREMNQLRQTTEHLKVLAHPLRLLIIRALRRNQHLTVGQLAGLCEVSQPLVSGHLRLLKDRGLLWKQRQGRQTFYHVSEPALARIVDCFGIEAG